MRNDKIVCVGVYLVGCSLSVPIALILLRKREKSDVQ